jgi:hypothetical protein
MKWVRRLSVLAGVTAAAVFGAGAQAQAAPPKNVGWLYTQSASGAVFFDADLAGYSSYEKITVCDNKSDGRGIRASLAGTHPNGGYHFVTLSDPSNDGNCVSAQANYFADGYEVSVMVFEYWGSNTAARAEAYGVA